MDSTGPKNNAGIHSPSGDLPEKSKGKKRPGSFRGRTTQVPEHTERKIKRSRSDPLAANPSVLGREVRPEKATSHIRSSREASNPEKTSTSVPESSPSQPVSDKGDRQPKGPAASSSSSVVRGMLEQFDRIDALKREWENQKASIDEKISGLDHSIEQASAKDSTEGIPKHRVARSSRHDQWKESVKTSESPGSFEQVKSAQETTNPEKTASPALDFSPPQSVSEKENKQPTGAATSSSSTVVKGIQAQLGRIDNLQRSLEQQIAKTDEKLSRLDQSLEKVKTEDIPKHRIARSSRHDQWKGSVKAGESAESLEESSQKRLSDSEKVQVKKAIENIYNKGLYRTGTYLVSDLDQARVAFDNPETMELDRVLAGVGLSDEWKQVADSASELINWCETCDPLPLPTALKKAIEQSKIKDENCNKTGEKYYNLDPKGAFSPLANHIKNKYDKALTSRREFIEKEYAPARKDLLTSIKKRTSEQRASQTLHASLKALESGLQEHGVKVQAAITQSLEDTWIKQILFSRSLGTQGLTMEDLPK